MTYDRGAPGGPGWPTGQQPVPGYGQPQYGQQPQYGAGPVGPPRKGFFGALFDFRFDHFATPSVVRVLYIIGFVLISLGYVLSVVLAFTSFLVVPRAGVGGILIGLLYLVVGAVAFLFYLTLFRVFLEFLYAVVRMSEDIHHRR